MSNLKRYSDNELVLLLKDGNHFAYTEIYERYFSLLYAHARKKIGDMEEARDLVQETFVTLWNRHESLAEQSEIVHYLFTVLRNKIINWVEHQQVNSRFITYFVNFYNGETAITDHRIREKQLLEIIEKEIQELPPRTREIFELSRKHHLSHKEIAEKLDISQLTVKTQIKRALRVLRLRLGVLLYIIMLIKLR